MPRDRRRGRRVRSQSVSKISAQSQQPSQPVSSEQAPTRKSLSAAPSPRTSGLQRQAVLENPYLKKDLRNVGIVAALVLVVLIVLWIVV